MANLQNGQVYLTSHAVYYVDKTEPRRRSIGIMLKHVDRTDFYAGFLKSSPKVTLYSKPRPRSPRLSPGGRTRTGSGAGVGRDRERTTPGTWICPICSFSNPVPTNFDPTIANSNSVLVPCQTCGVHPPLMVVVKAALAARSGRGYALVNANNTPTTTTIPTPTSDSKGKPCRRCTFVNHPSLPECEMCHFPVGGDGPRQAPPDEPIPTPDLVKLSFRAGGEKVFYERLKGALVQRKWLLDSAPPVAKPSTAVGASAGRGRAVGIASLERRGHEVRLNNERVISSAFEDLEALMASAKEVIALAESFSAGSSAADSALASESAAALGLVTATTKDMVGSHSESLYLSELSRNVAEFVTDDHRGVLRREGGIITLVDLWAVYNRARGGVELVSPADFGRAAELWGELGLPVRLRRFRRTGLLVVQQADRTDAKTMAAVSTWLAGMHEQPDPGADPPTWDFRSFGRGVTVQDAARHFGWSVGVATEELEMAEENGLLCRDVGPDGIRFWENWLVREV